MDQPGPLALYARRYLRSPLGIASLFLSLAAGGALLAAGTGVAASLAAALAVFAAAAALGLLTGLGPRAAGAEAERQAAARDGSRLETVALARRRLAALRLGEGPVAAARDLLVLEAGRLLESGVGDPVAVAAVEEGLALADAWLRERDEAATERRFGLPDANPFPDAPARSAAALRDKAAIVTARRAEATGELPPAEVMAIEEELK